MPCAVDYILEGIARNLELGREGGAFFVDFDRDFLATLPKERALRSPGTGTAGTTGTTGTDGTNGTTGTNGTDGTTGTNAIDGGRLSGPSRPSGPGAATPKFDFVFLHHAAMTGASAEMMANVITKGIKKTPETAPVVYAGERPPAKIYVVLGAKALNQWYGGVTIANGGWFRDVDSEVFYTWSPDDICRFNNTLTDAVMQKKRDMWKGLQEGMRKISS